MTMHMTRGNALSALLMMTRSCGVLMDHAIKIPTKVTLVYDLDAIRGLQIRKEGDIIEISSAELWDVLKERSEDAATGEVEYSVSENVEGAGRGREDAGDGATGVGEDSAGGGVSEGVGGAGSDVSNGLAGGGGNRDA